MRLLVLILGTFVLNLGTANAETPWERGRYLRSVCAQLPAERRGPCYERAREYVAEMIRQRREAAEARAAARQAERVRSGKTKIYSIHPDQNR